jgi:hypothetical protein
MHVCLLCVYTVAELLLLGVDWGTAASNRNFSIGFCFHVWWIKEQ